jgi:hypothetical protein
MPAVQTFSLAVEGTPAFAQYLKELIEGTIWPDSARPSSTRPLIVTIRSTWSCGFDSSAH